MAALTSTATSTRVVTGNLVARSYTVSGTNGDTLTVPQQGIVHVDPTPTTAIAVGCTVAGSVITFVTVGAFAANVMVFSREG